MQDVRSTYAGRLTFPYLRLALALAPRLKVIKAVNHGQDLDGAYGREHVRIVMGRGAEAAAFMLAGENKVYGFLARERIGSAQEMQGV